MRLITRHWQLKLLSLFLSMTTWAIVVYAGDPPQAQVIKGVNIEHGPLPANLSLLQALPSATVTVAGLSSSIGRFKRESIRVSVDLHAVHVGDNVVQVHVDNSDPTITVREVVPAAITAHIDTLFSVVKKVDPRVIGKPDPLYQAGTATATPDSVTISGARTLVEAAQPYVVVDVSNLKAPVDKVLTVQFDDTNHKAIQAVSATPSQVTEHVPIELNQQQIVKSVLLDTVGSVAAGYHISDIQLNPATVVIAGLPQDLNGVDAMHTENLNLGGATSDIATTLRLRSVPGITVITPGLISVHVFVVRDQNVQPSPEASPSPSPSPH